LFTVTAAFPIILTGVANAH